MKKTIIILLITILTYTVLACGEKQKNTDNKVDLPQPETITTVVDEQLYTTEAETVAIIETEKATTVETVTNAEENKYNFTDAKEAFEAFASGQATVDFDMYGTGLSFKELSECDYLYEDLQAGEQLDFDNDGENEMLMYGKYGDLIIDYDNDKLNVGCYGMGNAIRMAPGYYKDAYWIAYYDISHQGMEYFEIKKYNGFDSVVESFEMSSEFNTSTDGKYNNDSIFMLEDKVISMEEYEQIRNIFVK